MGMLARIVTARRGKWLVVAGWIVLLAAVAPLGAKLADVTDNRTESFLPAEAESTEVLRIQKERFPGGESVSGLVVYHRPGGLTAADRRVIAEDARRAAEALPLVAPPADAQVSPRGDVAYLVVALPADNERLGEWGKTLRRITGEGGDGLRVYVTGTLGFTADFEEIFAEVDFKLLLVTVLLVLVLLGLIYRSPAIAVIPLVVLAIAYGIAQGLVYLYARSGATVNDNGVSILVVLMFGVGTDYCLLLVSRYREELRRYQDKHEAMAHALRRTGPAILASGLTVSLTMLVLLLADLGSDAFARPGDGDRGRGGDGRRPHAAAGAAHDRRAPRLLAAPEHRRVPARGRRRRRARRALAACRRACPAPPRPGARLDRRAVRGRLARAARLQGGLQHRGGLQGRHGERRRLRGHAARVPGRRAVPDHGARDARGRRRPSRRRRRGAGADRGRARRRVRSR